MGASKNWRGAPGWQGRNTPGGDTKGSSGPPVVKAEGTHMSGGQSLRSGAKAGGNKSSSRKVSGKVGRYGQS